MIQDANISTCCHGEPQPGKFVLKFWAPRVFELRPSETVGIAELVSPDAASFAIQHSVDQGENWTDVGLLRFEPNEKNSIALAPVEFRVNKGDMIGIYRPVEPGRPPQNVSFTLKASVDDGSL